MELKSIRLSPQEGQWFACFSAPDAVQIAAIGATPEEAIDSLVGEIVSLYSERCRELNEIRRVLGWDGMPGRAPAALAAD